jgi:hypothetical protein
MVYGTEAGLRAFFRFKVDGDFIKLKNVREESLFDQTRETLDG